MAHQRLQQLDALRGIAALAVVLFHYYTNYDRKYGHPFEPAEFFGLGATGVYLFFMISGFVIFWTLNRSERPMDFVFSRFSRLYPVFWVAMLISFTFTTTVGPDDRAVGFETLAANVTMFHEFGGYGHVDNVYWTLGIELMFYILAFCAFMLRLLRFVDWICLLWLGVAIGVKVSGVDPGLMGKALILDYAFLFISGIAFYRVWKGEATKLTLLCLALGPVVAFLSYSFSTAATIVFWMGCFALVIHDRLQWLNQPVLLWLGGISYTLYLIHQNIGYGLIQWGTTLDLSPHISIAVALAISLALAHILHIWVEKPSIRLLRGWYSEPATFWAHFQIGRH